MKYDCVIFDIDGTLADPAHRIAFVRTKPKNWQAFENGLINDPVIPPVKMVMESLYKSMTHACMIIVTARPERNRETTTQWLMDNDIWHMVEHMYMRKDNDYREDSLIKKEILDEIRESYNPKFVFDDRHAVVDMWRENGLYVFDCNQTREIF